MTMGTFGEVPLQSITMSAGADLSAKQYILMRFAGANTVNQASHAAAAHALAVVGVLQNKPTAGQAAQVAVFGMSKVVAGGAITAGRALATNGSGKAAHAASGDICFGRAMIAAGADGDIITAMIFPPYRLSGAN